MTLLAVTKGHPAAAVEAAVAAGLRDIGESRVQEALAKQAAVDCAHAGAGADGELDRQRLRWHLIGHLQHNKAKVAAAVFDTVQSLDSVRIASALAGHRADGATPLRVFLEVEMTGLPSRTGIPPDQLDALAAAVSALPRLELVGLMTVAAPGPEAATRALFSRLRDLRDSLRRRHAVPLDELSMGMSDDFEVAVEEGATLVRLGRVLFGDRPR
ncbi:MAG: YggS family pyridoxal phosphate-dependent enzyme [Candidatus Dormibacteraeota bacterium]|nr:YggS family pyridoxal phosphate-dependent enzyme [Candidatus Dormibacteraeota bacterium]